GKVGGEELLVGCEIGRNFQIAQPQARIDALEQAAHPGADGAGSTGDENRLHRVSSLGSGSSIAVVRRDACQAAPRASGSACGCWTDGGAGGRAPPAPTSHEWP